MDQYSITLERFRCRNQGTIPFLQSDATSSLSDLLAQAENVPAEQKKSFVEFLGELKHPTTIPVLLSMLRSADQELTPTLSHAIATIGGEEAWTGLRGLLSEQLPQHIRLAVVYALCWLMDDRAFLPLLELMQDRCESAPVRAQAAEGLTYLALGYRAGSQEFRLATRAFLTGLGDANKDVQFWSIYALGNLPVDDTQRAEALQKLRLIVESTAADESATNGSIRSEAEEAIEKILSQASRRRLSA